ncbi:MAG: ArdC-like ssDNA-binding domain-containing protein [Casimicrobiaceae bacterium]|nr:ArdC-like ssDNA-binding domain-containing protein [Casimicrobiaceae bacterium]
MKGAMTRPDWGKLFDTILAEPGKLGEHYGYFHRYSLGNQALAIMQMEERGIPVGPISSFNGWKKLGRRVKKGEKAIALWMPVTSTKKVEKEDGAIEETTRRFFVMKNNWFALSQTEPEEGSEDIAAVVAATPGWDKATALEGLGIVEVPFTEVDGNVQGFARPSKREIAVSPLAAFPWKTTFHELAHCLLHADRGEMSDGETIPHDIAEAEAEAVAFLCCATLGLPGLEEARGYVQSWLATADRREAFKKCASRVFAAADRILKAGVKAALDSAKHAIALASGSQEE